jgi:hypothetical protein
VHAGNIPSISKPTDSVVWFSYRRYRFDSCFFTAQPHVSSKYVYDAAEGFDAHVLLQMDAKFFAWEALK